MTEVDVTDEMLFAAIRYLQDVETEYDPVADWLPDLLGVVLDASPNRRIESHEPPE